MVLIVYTALRIFHFGRKVHMAVKYPTAVASRLGSGRGTEDERVLFAQSILFGTIHQITGNFQNFIGWLIN